MVFNNSTMCIATIYCSNGQFSYSGLRALYTQTSSSLMVTWYDTLHSTTSTCNIYTFIQYRMYARRASFSPVQQARRGIGHRVK